VFTTIAVATDGSPSGANAFAVAEDLARHVGAKLTIIHVQEVAVGRGGVFVRSNQATLTALHDRAERLRREGIEATVSVSSATDSKVARTIANLATEAGAELLIVGNRGHGPLAGLVFGSVARQLERIAPCPVLTVPFRYTPATAAAKSAERAPDLTAVAK
jgi:nucleotide-binding universal stress UspA family protein